MNYIDECGIFLNESGISFKKNLFWGLSFIYSSSNPTIHHLKFLNFMTKYNVYCLHNVQYIVYDILHIL